MRLVWDKWRAYVLLTSVLVSIDSEMLGLCMHSVQCGIIRKRGSILQVAMSIPSTTPHVMVHSPGMPIHGSQIGTKSDTAGKLVAEQWSNSNSRLLLQAEQQPHLQQSDSSTGLDSSATPLTASRNFAEADSAAAHSVDSKLSGQEAGLSRLLHAQAAVQQ